MRRRFSNAAPQWRAFIGGGASSLAVSAGIEDADAVIVFDAAGLRHGERGDINLLRQRGHIGIKPQFVEWREKPTKVGSSPAVELQ